MPTKSAFKSAALKRQVFAAVMLSIGLSLTGCTAILSPIDSIPAERVPPQFLVNELRADTIEVDSARLRMTEPEFYILDEGDVLGLSLIHI